MPSRIQNVPRGLLSALGIYGEGINPRELNEQLQATFDLSPLYLSKFFTIAGATTAAVNAVGAGALVTVPSGKAWIPVSAQLQATGGAAGDQIRMALTSRISTGTFAGVQRFHISPLLTQVAAAGELSDAFFFPRNIVLLPGNTLQVRVEDIAVVGAFTVGIGCSVYQFDL